MICLVCECGHAAPYPESTGRYRCTVCDRVTQVTWFGAPNALDKYRRWVPFARARGAVRGKTEFRVTSQANGQPSLLAESEEISS